VRLKYFFCFSSDAYFCSRSYLTHFHDFAKAREALFPATWQPQTRSLAGCIASVVAPRGLHIRTSQICGSFVIINGIINFLSSSSS
jgi:hypothetical protein